jgi:hypothetical protein
MNRTEIRDLAQKARTDLKVARGAFRKLAVANGYKGQAGGWIYHQDRTYASIVQGWQGLADLVYRNPGMFAVTLERDEQDQRAAEAEEQLEEADEASVPAPAPKVKPLTPAMQRAVDILRQDGYVDKIDGITVGTIVALMERGILREATPLRHGLSAGRHYPATTPEQVWDEAHDTNAQYFYADWDAALVEDDERSGGWGQPDGMTGTSETPAPARARLASPDEARHALNGELTRAFDTLARHGSAPAPTLADDVAALREEIYTFADKSAEIVGAAEHAGGTEVDAVQVELDALSFSIEARLDRIAARAPQRAFNRLGQPMWLHTCGAVRCVEPPAMPFCDACSTLGTWRALFVEPDGTR